MNQEFGRFTVTDVTVIVAKNGLDKVFLQTTFPTPFSPNFSTEMLCLEFSAAQGAGVEYVEKTLGLKVNEVINRA